MRIVFFGTPMFAANTLEGLAHKKKEVVAIVSKPDKPQGRSSQLIPTHVKKKAQLVFPSCPVIQPEKASSPEVVSLLRSFEADLFVVVAYGEILKQEILDIPKLGCINVHASLLPLYRGAAPIQRCLMHGDAETGISIIKLVRKMDAGDVLKVKRLPVSENMTFPELEHALCLLGLEALEETIDELEKGMSVAVSQEHDKATFAEKIIPTDCQIDWNQSAYDIHNLVRALTPHPGAFCYVNIRGEKKRLKILRSKPLLDVKNNPGKFSQISKNIFCIGCGTGSLQVVECQLEGKPVMAADTLLRGYLITEISCVM